MLQPVDIRTNLTVRPTIPLRVIPFPASKPAIRLRNAIAVYSILEFLTVAAAAFGAHIFYHYIFLHSFDWELAKAYGFSGLTLATLVLLFSLAFQNFNAVRRQARDVFLWRGLGAVALAFSTFVTILVFIQLADRYSRGTLIFQVIAVGCAVAVCRMVFYSWYQNAIASNRIDARRIVLIGDEPYRSACANRLWECGIRTAGAFSLPKD